MKGAYRAKTVIEGLRAQQYSGGGFGYKPLKQAAPSIVNSTEAILAAKALKVPASDPMIKDAFGYLVDRVRVQIEHLDKRSNSPRTRFAAYGIIGLRSYAGAFPDRWSEVQEVLDLARMWLIEQRREDHAWSEEGASEINQASVHPNVFSTSLAVRALDLVGENELAAEGRDWLAENAQKTGSHVYWSEFGRGRGKTSPGCTSHAMLALLNGTDGHVDLARRGAGWLMANHQLWRSRPETSDALVRARVWTHETALLCPLVCLRAGKSLTDSGGLLASAITDLVGDWDGKIDSSTRSKWLNNISVASLLIILGEEIAVRQRGWPTDISERAREVLTALNGERAVTLRDGQLGVGQSGSFPTVWIPLTERQESLVRTVAVADDVNPSVPITSVADTVGPSVGAVCQLHKRLAAKIKAKLPGLDPELISRDGKRFTLNARIEGDV